MEWRVRRIGLVLLVTVAALGALALLLPGLLGVALTEALRRGGLPDATAEVTSLRPGETVATLRLGDDSARIAVRHPLGRLLGGRAERIAISGATLRLSVDEAGGIRVAGLPPGDGQGGGVPVLPVDEIVVEDSRILLESPSRSAAVSVSGRLHRVGDAMDADIDLHGEGVDLGLVTAFAGLRAVVEGQANIAGTLRGRIGDAVRLSPEGCLTVTAPELSVEGEPVALPKGLCLQGADGPALELADDAVHLRLAATAAALGLPTRRIGVENMALALSYDRPALTVELTRGVLRSQERPPTFAPFHLAGKAERPDGGPVTLQATVTGLDGVTLDVRGRHDLGSGAGSADLRLRPITFREGGPSPAGLAPRYAGTVSAAGGQIVGRGRLAWGDAFTSDGEVLLRDVAGTLGPVTVGGVSGVLRLSSLVPPVLPSGQTVAVKLLDVGLPLTDGQVTVGLTRRGILDVDRAEWRWAGGLVRAKPFEIALGSPEGTIELEAEELDLGIVLGLAALEGLDATGTLRGTLPVRFGKDAVRLDSGVLEAVGPGTLRYDPAKPPEFLKGDPGSPTDMLMSALTDFRFESLRATVDGEAGGDMRVGLAIRGANPAFYDGYPVALNLNLSGALDRILRRGLDAYRIPDAVRERMLEFERKGPS
ncbi:MAG TPA: YdbH domain-containing protein [Azospirillum sp.]|nr:YdbH domain-containing protein [Azospirillum sp.]